jgi:hypothetical protein
MEVGKLYKSLGTGVILECLEIKDKDFFKGKVVIENSYYPIGTIYDGWFIHAFQEYIKEELPYVKEESPTNDQIGGSHYKKLKIQPTEFIHANNLSFIEGNIIKYVVRHKDKNGIEDLKKAKHYIDLLIKFEYEDPKKL